MTEHLSKQQIEDLLIDGANQQVRDHLINCASCRSQWGYLDEVLQLYRSSATFAANSVVSSRPMVVLQSRSKATLPELKWIFAAALVLGLSFPLFEHHQEQQKHNAEMARDNLLLEQIDQVVSDPVPQPLNSLRYLVDSEKTVTITPSTSKQESNENK